jgi:hypothetical protein
MPTTFLSERIASLLLALAVIPSTGQDSTTEHIQRAAGPRVPVHSVYAPRFQTSLGDMIGGSGFIVRVAGEPSPLFLTAHQRFTSAAGLDRDYDSAELATLVRNVEAYSIDDSGRTLTAGPGPTIIGAGPTRSGAAWRDLAVFSVTEGGGPALSLAAHGPRNGQRIWLYARVDTAPGAPLLTPAIVERSTTGSLGYRFENPNARLEEARGAPMLDRDGRVVAMHVSERMEQGYLRGTGNPVDSIRRMLARATSQGDASASAGDSKPF